MTKELLERLKDIAKRLKREYGAEKVILYGSYAKGEETEDSDIDIFVIAPTDERFFERMATVVRIIRDLRKGLAIEPIVMTREEVEDRIEMGDEFVKQIIEEGVPL